MASKMAQDAADEYVIADNLLNDAWIHVRIGNISSDLESCWMGAEDWGK